MKEVLILADEQDRLIGYAPRDFVHKNKLLHRASGVVIINDKGGFLVQKRGRKDVYAGYYEASLSGHVTKGEDYKTTALRELKEEFGIKARKLKFLKKLRIRTKQENYFIKIFLLKHSGRIKINKKEVSTAKFMNSKEISKKKLNDWCRFTIQHS